MPIKRDLGVRNDIVGMYVDTRLHGTGHLQDGGTILSILNGYDEQRAIRDVRFESLRINSRMIHDKMPGKPGWYKTWDMMPAYVGNHVEGVVFNATR